MSSSASSTVSPSPPASPRVSHREPPDLSRLIQHFIAVKRALNSTQHVQRVSEVVSDTRLLIERTAIQTAKNEFAKERVHEQLGLLQTIQANIFESGITVDSEFSATVSKLDAAHDRLQATLDQLKKVVVDTSLRHSNDGEEAKTLFDFVDESQYEGIQASLKNYIDTHRAAEAQLQSSLAQLDEHIVQTTALVDPAARPDSPTIKPSIYDEPLLPPAEAFTTMEDHAGEIAGLLHSLISHYDLCVTALKHTEGGREAAKSAVMADPEDLHASNTMEESLFSMKLTDPISEEERTQMLQVLESDVDEVEEVTIDIRERGSELERLHAQFRKRYDTAMSTNKDIRGAVSLLRTSRRLLPEFVMALSAFQDTWAELSVSIEAQLADIANLQAFYEEFQTGYKKLLREVDRRKAVEMQMRKLATRAQRDLDSLYKADKVARDEFIADVASFLPSDLWAGVAETGVKWMVQAAEPEPEMSQQIEELERPS